MDSVHAPSAEGPSSARANARFWLVVLTDTQEPVGIYRAAQPSDLFWTVDEITDPYACRAIAVPRSKTWPEQIKPEDWEPIIREAQDPPISTKALGR